MSEELQIEHLKRVTTVARHLGVGRATVYQMIRDGRLEGVSIAGVMFVVYPDLADTPDKDDRNGDWYRK